MSRKPWGQISISNADVQRYLKRNKINQTFLILNQSIITSEARYGLFREKAQQCRNFILNYQSPQENVSYDIVKLQLMHLHLLTNIFMLLEDFLGHSHNLKLSTLEHFPKLIASRNDGVASREISALEKLNAKSISSYLLFCGIIRPNRNEQQLLENNLNNMAKDILNRIKNVLQFYSKYYRVYVKYKHILPAVLGVHHKKYDTEQNFTVASSYIYVRDYLDYRNKKDKTHHHKKDKFYTHIVLASGLEPLTYYESIMDNIKKVYNIILLAYLNYMSNLGKPFLIPVANYVDSKDRAQLEGIISNVNTCSVTKPMLKIEFNITNPLKELLEKNLLKDTIYRLGQDIFFGTK